MQKSSGQNASLWDKKANQYNRFSHDTHSFQHLILNKIAHRGITFEGKTILDIGCGTGVYTLHIAKNALHVTALDFSQEMLNILHHDALQEHLDKKLTLICNSWSDFKTDTPFDIIYSSMSPAFKSDADFAKMHALSKEDCIYLGWGGKRESTLLDPIFKAHGRSLNVPEGSEKLKLWLEKEKIVYESEYIEEKRTVTKSYDEALESVMWHFEINALTPDSKRIKTCLQSMVTATGEIPICTSVRVELVSWKKH